MNDEHQRFLDYYENHKNRLLTFLMYRVNFDRLLAEDLLMDIVLKAYSNFYRFNPDRGSFTSWIFTLAHNHLKNHWRDNHGKETVSLENLEEGGFTAATVAPEEGASNDIESANLQRVLALLSPAEREIISLRYLQELEYSEIAQIIDREEGAVRTALSRALEHLKTRYQKIYPQNYETA